MSLHKIITFKQPAGEFAMLSMPINELIKISYFSRRTEDSQNGIQRRINPTRIRSIAKFVDEEKDATVFPTPIILALPYDTADFENISQESSVAPEEQNYYKFDFENNLFEVLDDSEPFAKVIDGQHRLIGISESNAYKTNNLNLEMPVLLVIGADIWTQAYLFAKINGEQRQVPYSFVADLFELSPHRNIQTVSHKMIKALNESPNSALKGCIKMLGIRIDEDQTLSQGTIAREFEKLLMAPKGTLCKYYESKADEDIMQIMINYFNGIYNNWKSDWNDPTGSIIRKTVGFLGFIKSFPDIFKLGLDKGTLEEDFFSNVFSTIRLYFNENGFQLTKDRYSSNAAGASLLKNDILAGLSKFKF